MRPMPHGYTNDSRTDGTVVVKRYEGPLAARRRDTERTVLARLPDGLPAPRVLEVRDGALVLPYVAGTHGQDLIAAGHAPAVLRSCGAMLRRLQQMDAADVFPGATGTLVHGDFGPNNMLFDPDTFAVTALLDWEWAHPGDPVEDLAWCEWIVRMHHPGDVPALDHLFAGYGGRPPWPLRHAAALARCHELLTLVGDGGPWRDRIAVTAAWSADGPAPPPG